MEDISMRMISGFMASLALAGCGAILTPHGAPDPGSGSGDAPGDAGSGNTVDHAPTIAVVDSLVHDERGDVVDFTSGDPVHTHAGPPVDLGAPGCPAIYKYAYLMDPSEPAFGSETTRNALAWQLAVDAPAGVDADGASFRVRDASDRVVADWAAIAVDASGRSRIELDRSGDHGIAELATATGQFHLDLKIRDRVGREVVTALCWDHHPLTAPLELGAVTAATGANALAGMTLAADSPISIMLNSGSHDVATALIVQHTAEPIELHVGALTATGRFTKTVADRYVTTATTTFACGTTDLPIPDPHCATTPYVDAPDATTSGTLGSAAWLARVTDEQTGTVLTCGADAGCTLPPRGPGEPPHGYRLTVSLGAVDDLRPALVGPFDEFPLASRVYTGIAPITGFSNCTQRTLRLIRGVTYIACASADYARMIALAHVTLSFDSIAVALSTAIAGSTPTPISTLPGGQLIAPPMTWDSGVDVLPGQ